MSSLPFKVKAVYEYTSPHDDDLNFPLGQIITVTEEEGDDWYIGEYLDGSGAKQDGLFPRNFVERYEPEAPPRPTRNRTKKEAVPLTEPEPEIPQTYSPIEESSHSPERFGAPQPSAPVAPVPAAQPAPKPTAPRAPEPPAATASVKGPPPAVAEKPSSFKDRIAAFNKTSSSPVAPIKPAAPAGGGFVKKAFVAPPPARDAYVPVHRDPGPSVKVYRREEDPEIAERQAQDQEDAEKAGLIPSTAEEGAEEAPRATTLKERIAALQKQQQEQAARRADLVTKRPVKQRTESGDTLGGNAEPDPDQLARVSTHGSTHRISVDEQRDNSYPGPAGRSSHDYVVAEGTPRSILNDGNDANQSAAGRMTEEAESMSTEVEDRELRARHASPTISSPRMPRHEEEVEEADQPDEDEGQGAEDEIDAETRRKIELRERMAKMSGGMGMAGMFGAPLGAPKQSAAPRQKRPSGTSENRPSMEEAQAMPMHRVPVIPIPGMHRAESPERLEQRPEVGKEAGPITSITAGRDPEQVLDIEDIEPLPTRAEQSPVYPTRQQTIPTTPTNSGRPVPAPQFPHPQSTAPSVPAVTNQGRQVPPAPQARAVPPPPPQAVMSTGPRYESDDVAMQHESGPGPQSQRPPPQRAPSMRGPPPPIPAGAPMRVDGPRSPPLNTAARNSYMPEPAAPMSPTQRANDNRSSQGPPPIPMGASATSTHGQMRGPPPPPPIDVSPIRQYRPDTPTEEESDQEGSDEEGDYEADNAAGPGQRDTMQTHSTEQDSDEDRHSEEYPTRAGPAPPMAAPIAPPQAPRAGPPMPPQIQRGAPPPPAHQPQQRYSTEAPRSMPPIPPSREAVGSTEADEGGYDPYRYTAPSPTDGVLPSTMAWMPDRPIHQESDPSLYEVQPQRPAERAPQSPPQGMSQQQRSGPPPPPIQPQQPPPSLPQGMPQQQRTGPPLPPNQPQQPPPMTPGAAPRPSRDLAPQSMSTPPTSFQTSPSIPRQSTDQSRPSSDQSYMARDMDLGEQSLWWTRPKLPPPAFQNSSTVLCEFEESSTSKRGGRMTITKDVYVLWPDYSQTFITARFDSKNPADVVLEQRHEAPPPRPRQDVLEAAHQHFGPGIAAAAHQRTGHVVLDGSPHALILDVLRTRPNALLPVGTSAYGVVIYANLSNATVQQFDEIRAGDIITFRNAKFQGKHGAMHAKYSEEVGKPEHVGIVAEWDGSKRKVRFFEQGRDGKRGVRVEGFRVGDLRSGEVKVWRVVGRRFVGWETQE